MTLPLPLRKSAVYLLLCLMALFILYPLLYTFLSIFMTPEETNQFPPKLLPSSLYLGSLEAVIDLIPVGRFILNSFLVSGLVMIGQLITASLAAYAFAFISFRGKAIWFAVFLSTMMIPWEVTMIPNFLLIKSWNWLDTYPGLVFPFLASAFGVFLLRQFYLQLPKELFEAAKMDGCGHLRYFANIVLPLSRPGLATLAVYVFLNTWNMYLWPLLITNTAEMRTVQIGVSMLQFEEFTAWNIVLSGVALVLLPSLLLIVLGLKQLVRGLTAGAVKG
ncbi:carbohydrate ABC transporter permease [Paenibacillus sp. Marseille-P2973]|uniref:carbohydrate ABC transporter permease n=1 Tax=Paenibacillus TaxID=44249 RepID=UPI001B37E716|nr:MULTISPECIES: carbohydrate ABC transporter permease [Paenibacillus]MBQ4900148.1 carbohydrate ABC transporter permease [Paenibacillus sp. Marseille-P2973]MDN4066302.1 carbohydrate ABC transporter permease [Paenibacillus vini]